MKQKELSILIGVGVIGLAVIKEVCEGRHVLLADLDEQKAKKAAQELEAEGIETITASVDVTSKSSLENLAIHAKSVGEISQVVIATGVSPSNSSPEVIFKVDLLGVALALEVFKDFIAQEGAGLVIGSQAGHRLKALNSDEDQQIAKVEASEILNLPIFKTEKCMDSLYAYQLAKRASSLRVKSEAVRWGKRGARVNILSPGIVMTPLSEAEFKSQNAELYKKMINECPAKRTGSPDEVAALAKVIMGENGGFITGSDFLIDGGVSAAYLYGDLKL